MVWRLRKGEGDDVPWPRNLNKMHTSAQLYKMDLLSKTKPRNLDLEKRTDIVWMATLKSDRCNASLLLDPSTLA